MAPPSASSSRSSIPRGPGKRSAQPPRDLRCRAAMSRRGNPALIAGNAPRRRTVTVRGLLQLRRDAVRGARQDGTAMAYYTNVGPLPGPLLVSAGYFAIGVLQARQAYTPIGMALVAGQDENGLAL